VNVVSTHGAGDAFIGALAVKLASGAALEDAARFASAAAALHVSAPTDKRAEIDPKAIEKLAQTSNR
jgi:ribokinase